MTGRYRSSTELATTSALQACVEVGRSEQLVRLLPAVANSGLAANINRGMAACRGELVVVAAGDDVSDRTRVERLVALWLQRGGGTACLASAARVIDADGNDLGPYLQAPPAGNVTASAIASTLGGVLGCSAAWTPDLFAVFGDLDPVISREDAVIPFRAALIGQVWCSADPLVLYRLHDSNFHFKEPGHLTSTELVDGLRKHAAGNRALLQQMQRDLDKTHHLGLVDIGFVMRLERALETAQRTADTEQRLSVDGLRRWAALLAALTANGIPARRRARWFLMFGTPWLYGWLRRRHRRGQVGPLGR